MGTAIESRPPLREQIRPGNGSGLVKRIVPVVKRVHLSNRRFDLMAIVVYVLGGFYITGRLWKDIGDRVTANNVVDFAFFEFVFAHGAHAVVNWTNPLFNGQLNAPDGVNMMANTSMLGMTIPLAPVTLTFGTKPAIALATVIGLAGTAIAWYYFLKKYVTTNRVLALVGAGFIGFAPGMVSQANAHPNITAQFMVPLIIDRVIRLREPERTLRHSLILTLMIVYQMFINEEILLYTAIICAILVAVYAMSRPAEARALVPRYLTGLAIAAVLSFAIMAYPLWFQFFGPQRYTGPIGWADEFGMDVAAFTNYATESIGGFAVKGPLANNAAEENAFFGWPLCTLALGFGIAYWRILVVRIAFIIGLSMAALSLGEVIRVNGKDSGIPGPWRIVSNLPLFDSIIVTRMAMLAAPAIAIILVIAAERVIPMLRDVDTRYRRPLYTLTACLMVMALWPVFPTPLAGTGQTPVPDFFSKGTWRQYVSTGHVVPVPPHPFGIEPMRWLVATDMTLPVAAGYFLGPAGPHNPVAHFGTPERPTGELLFKVSKTGEVPWITDSHRRDALTDLKAWRADILVLGPQGSNHGELRRAVNLLLGISGHGVDGVWVWDVRGLY